MYEHYFNLRESPFNLTADPRFFFNNGSAQEAFATLCYGVEQCKGIIVITGEAGTGKTTLLKLFMQNAAPGIHCSCILDPRLAFGELLQCAFDAFGLPPCEGDRVALIQRLHGYLIEQHRRGHVVALLLDEAQNLDKPVLDELRLLSGLDDGGERLLQIVLVGQPELDARLESPSLRPLKQRVALRSRLLPLREREIRSYIEFRLAAAGHSGKTIFTNPAIERIASLSAGIPRLVNVICDNALLTACATSRDWIGADIIGEVAADLRLEGHPVIAQSRAPQGLSPAEAPASTEAEDHFAPPAFDEIVADSEPVEEISTPSGIANAPTVAPAARVDRERPPSESPWPGLAIAFATLTMIVAAVFAAQQSLDLLTPVSMQLSRIKAAVAPLPGNIYRVVMAPVKVETVALDHAEADEPGDRLGQPYRQVSIRERRGSAPTTLEGDNLQRGKVAERPRRADQAPTRTIRRTANERPTVTRASSPSEYLVVGDSFVRNQPTAEARILVTLRPGTHVQVLHRGGDYLQVRSRERGLARGYVHREDAFFEPVKSPRHRTGH